MINLFYSFYLSEDRVRNSELLQALNHSISNQMIDNIYLMSTSELYESIKYMSNKLVFIEQGGIPSYKKVFSLIDVYTGESDINIITNSDCYFDTKTFYYIDQIKENEAWCLTRWDYDKEKKKSEFRNSSQSQDAWIIRGKPKEFNDIGFQFGRVGCDNRIAYELKEAGYDVKNPSKTIKLVHLHNSDIRTNGSSYSNREHFRVRGEYLFVEPTF